MRQDLYLIGFLESLGQQLKLQTLKDQQVEKTGNKNGVKVNKYQTLAQGGEIPLNPMVFKKILGKAQPEGDPINVWSTVKNNFEIAKKHVSMDDTFANNLIKVLDSK